MGAVRPLHPESLTLADVEIISTVTGKTIPGWEVTALVERRSITRARSASTKTTAPT